VSADPTGGFGAPLWRSAFRPFFLLAALYGPLVMVLGAINYAVPGAVPQPAFSLSLAHGHEMLFGFTGAVMSGFVLTALPSWAGVPAIAGGRLAFLVMLWTVGRLAVWFSPVLPPLLVAVLDLAYMPALMALVIPTLWTVRNKLYWAFVPILAGLFAANLAFYYGIATGDQALARDGVLASVYVIMILSSIVGGFLTPVFTDGHLKARGWDGVITFQPVLEVLAIFTILAFVISGIFTPGTFGAGLIALVTLVVHGIRWLRWRTLRILDVPILWVMHFAYFWLLVAFALRAWGDLGGGVPEMAPLHAFTIGSLSLMKIGLLTRIALRHTGRRVAAGPVMRAGFILMFLAVLLREGSIFLGLPAFFLSLSLVCWVTPFIFYLFVHGPMLWRPSLPSGAADRETRAKKGRIVLSR